MILPYKEKFENDGYWDFIGYISLMGEEIDYRMPFGLGGHSTNKTTDIFIKYIYYDLKGWIFRYLKGTYYKTNEDYQKAFREVCLEKLPKEIEEYQELAVRYYGKNLPDYYRLRLDLCRFFFNCYLNEDFFASVGRKFEILSWDEYHDWYTKGLSSDEIDKKYYSYENQMILSWFKDIMVMYLGYDSVETAIPKTITTSCLNPNERFYNYKLMDFNIVELPKMVYDKNMKIYRPFSSDIKSPKEEILQMEIEAIRKRIPINDRHKYFRQ